MAKAKMIIGIVVAIMAGLAMAWGFKVAITVHEMSGSRMKTERMEEDSSSRVDKDRNLPGEQLFMRDSKNEVITWSDIEAGYRPEHYSLRR